jgi:hypothetical protein
MSSNRSSSKAATATRTVRPDSHHCRCFMWSGNHTPRGRGLLVQGCCQELWIGRGGRETASGRCSPSEYHGRRSREREGARPAGGYVSCFGGRRALSGRRRWAVDRAPSSVVVRDRQVADRRARYEGRMSSPRVMQLHGGSRSGVVVTSESDIGVSHLRTAHFVGGRCGQAPSGTNRRARVPSRGSGRRATRSARGFPGHRRRRRALGADNQPRADRSAGHGHRPYPRAGHYQSRKTPQNPTARGVLRVLRISRRAFA